MQDADNLYVDEDHPVARQVANGSHGGLLTLVLGLSVQRTDDAIGWSLVVGGAVVAAAGFVLIYVRSKIKAGP